MTEPQDSPPGARLAQEARLLLDAFAQRAEPWLNELAAERDAPAGHTPATCGWCPVCAGIAVLRGDRPELAVRAAEHAAGLLAVLRSALHPPAEDSTDSTDPTDPAADPSGPVGPVGPVDLAEEPEPPSRVQRITIARRKPDRPTC
jgi:hypothetical protein